MLSAVKAVEDKLDEEIAALERLDPDDIEALRERRIQQMRRAKLREQGHGEYAEVPERSSSPPPRPASGSSATSTATARFETSLITALWLWLGLVRMRISW